MAPQVRLWIDTPLARLVMTRVNVNFGWHQNVTRTPAKPPIGAAGL